MFLEKFEERNLTFPFNTVGKDIFSRFLNELKSGKVIVPEKTVEYQPWQSLLQKLQFVLQYFMCNIQIFLWSDFATIFFHGLFHLFADADVVDDKATLFCAEFTVYTRNSLNKRMFR